MITTNNYNAQKISLDLLQDKKSRDGKKYQNIPILYDGRKALVHLCGRFQLIPDLSLVASFDAFSGNSKNNSDSAFGSGPDSLAIDVDADNRKLFEDFEEKLQSLTDYEVKLIKYGRVYLKLYLDEGGKPIPKFWKVFEKDGKEYKKRIWDKESLNWKTIEGEIVFSIANIFTGSGAKSKTKSIICIAKEILVREIGEMSYFSIPVGEDDEIRE